MSNPTAETGVEIAGVRARLAAAPRGRTWRSLEELAETPQFLEFLHREFPRQASEWLDTVSRRNFIKLMGASIALAGFGGCTKVPTEKIVPYVDAPEDIVPGKPLYFATAMPFNGYAKPVLVENHMGRPTKIEGNPEHPASGGGTDVWMQASILNLYDPDRSQNATYLGEISTWDRFLGQAKVLMEGPVDESGERISEDQGIRGRRGAGLRFLTGNITSPTLAEQLQTLLQELPEARWHQYEPVASDNALAGARLAFGESQAVEAIYRFDRANVVVSFDCNFFCDLPGSLQYSKQFAARRRPYDMPGDDTGNVPFATRGMNRLYAVESTPSLVGSFADHRLAVQARQIEDVARALAARLGALGESNAGERLTPFESQWVAAVAADLQLAENRGASIIVVGDSQPAVVHALAHAMNQRLGNVQARRDGAGTVAYVASVQPAAIDQMQSLRELTADIQQDRVELLVILGGNPVYNTPADLGFEELLLAKKDMVSVHLSEYLDETSWVCHWHIPAANYLESWSDARAYDGTATILQPLIAPLYDGRTAHEVVAALAGQADRSSYDLVRAHWERERGAEGFAEFWQRTLYYGFAADSQAELVAPELAASSSFAGAASPASAKGLELIFRPDPHVWDGRFANNGWLQELPRPLTKLTWDNVAFVSPATAEERKLKDGDVVKLQYREGEVRMPVWVLPWQANNSVSVALGFGRTRGVQVGRDVGANAYALRTSDAPWFGQGLEMVAINERYALSTTQSHHSMEGRDPVRFGELADYEHNPGFLHSHHDAHRVPGAPDDQPETPGSLYPEHPYEGYRWGMTIDLNSCMGCNACVVACQAENNIPVVGKVEVARGREMHWLRIDRYYYGAGNELADDQSYALDRPETLWQPMLCQHCENAPCEVVCPVAATVHSSEGLNEMVYNRCVGTRYCSNNCPYKVRRFNFFQYSDLKTPSLELMRNPDVTVRNRGVMEKCTFCVQRINLARIDAKKRDAQVQDGDIVTACQAACPSQAIVFGDINDPKSKVHHLKHEPLNYGVLADLNTQPRTSYLGRVMNPNPALLDLERKTYGRQLPHG